MSVRALLCAVLALSVVSAQAGGLPLPKKGLLLGGAAVVIGAGAVSAAKKHCTTSIDPDTGGRRPHCEGINVEGLQEKAGDAAETVKTSLSNYRPRKALNHELGATGEPPNPQGCEAHHIVPRRENRVWARQSANAAREAIEGCIDIDAVENGVYLPAKDGAQCFGRKHTGLHTRAYYSDIARRLVDARSSRGCVGVERKLLEIKHELSSGMYP